MRNSDSLPCCDVPRSRKVTLLGKEVAVRNYVCAPNGGNYRPKEKAKHLQLSILPTWYCNAHCPFCIAAPTMKPGTLDPAVLEKVLLALREEDCVRGISITGGEPFTQPDLVSRAVAMIFGIFGYGMEVTISTNGTGLRHLTEIRDLPRVDAVHISRHHWDDRENDAIFGRKMIPAEELRDILTSIGIRDLFVLNCMLLRGGVETPEDAHRYLDFAIETGAGKVAFITGSPVNEYIVQRRVPYEEALRAEDPRILFTRGYRDFDCCRCQDGVYVSPRGQLIEFYGRHTEPARCNYCRGLVLEPDGSLHAGFGGPVLLQV